jgi:hypothetical protein
MAMTCAHCSSADVSALFNTWQCFNCGRHTTNEGRKILPDSMCYNPVSIPNMEAWGWPYDDQDPSILRGIQVAAEQWGLPLTRQQFATKEEEPA